MKVSRKDLLYWGTIAIIAFFFLEFFWPMMYSQEQAAPTPSPEAPTTFIGSAIVQAKIMYFSDEAYVFCNSSKANFIKSLESVSGTYKHNGPWAADDFSLYINATNETQDREVIERLNTIISSECGEGSVVMRNAGLNLTIGDVTEKTNITFQSEKSFNDSRTSTPQDLLNAFRNHPFRMGTLEIEGFVEAVNSVNNTVPVSIAVNMVGTDLDSYNPFPRRIEQLRFTKPFVQ